MIVVSDTYINNPLVSVFIITYNQQDTLAQTIDSILAQQGDFSMELIIGEDASTDNTKQICIEYQKRYPNTIKLLLQETNQGLVKNYIDTLRLCKGEFIALCAGDDYWLSNHKIQKQLAYLNEHPDYGVVSTNGYRLLVKANKLIKGLPPKHPDPTGDVFKYTCNGGVYAMPLTLMFRASLLKYIDFEQFIVRKFSCEDVPMQAVMAKHTKFGHINELLVVYRVYEESMTFTTLNKPQKYLDYHQGLVNIYRYINELFPGEIGFTDDWAHNYMKYREFLLATYHFDFESAQAITATFLNPTKKEIRAENISHSKISFFIFACLKRVKLYLDARSRLKM